FIVLLIFTNCVSTVQNGALFDRFSRSFYLRRSKCETLRSIYLTTISGRGYCSQGYSQPPFPCTAFSCSPHLCVCVCVCVCVCMYMCVYFWGNLCRCVRKCVYVCIRERL